MSLYQPLEFGLLSRGGSASSGLRCRFWNDPVALEKLGKAFGGLGGLPPGFAARGVGADGVNDEDEEEEEEEDEDAPELHKAVQDADGSVEGVTKVIKAGGKGVRCALSTPVAFVFDLVFGAMT